MKMTSQNSYLKAISVHISKLSSLLETIRRIAGAAATRFSEIEQATEQIEGTLFAGGRALDAWKGDEASEMGR